MLRHIMIHVSIITNQLFDIAQRQASITVAYLLQLRKLESSQHSDRAVESPAMVRATLVAVAWIEFMPY